MSQSPFRGDFFKNEAIAMLTMFSPVVAIALIFMLVIVPYSQKKPRQMQRDMRTLASAAEEYERKEKELPLTLQQLIEFEDEFQSSEREHLPLSDPWGQRYVYLRISSETALIGTSGRNKRFEKDLATLPVRQNLQQFHMTKSLYMVPDSKGDDWIFVIAPGESRRKRLSLKTFSHRLTNNLFQEYNYHVEGCFSFKFALL